MNLSPSSRSRSAVIPLKLCRTSRSCTLVSHLPTTPPNGFRRPVLLLIRSAPRAIKRSRPNRGKSLAIVSQVLTLPSTKTTNGRLVSRWVSVPSKSKTAITGRSAGVVSLVIVRGMCAPRAECATSTVVQLSKHHPPTMSHATGMRTLSITTAALHLGCGIIMARMLDFSDDLN